MSSQTQSNIEIVEAIYVAYGTKDVDALLSPLHDDFQISASDPLPWGGRYSGREGMMEFIGKISSYIDSRVDVDEMVDAGDHVIAIGQSAGTIKATGKEYSVRLVDVCQIRDGKILSIDIYLDTPAILAELAG